MPMLVLVILTPILAAIHLWHRRRHDKPTYAPELFLVWWFGLALGVTSIIGAGFHIFAGQYTADLIGFTRGDGGFQFENAMGDLAIGVLAICCIWLHGKFWLATIIFSTIQYYGDAYGHVYQWVVNDNTKSGNIGPPLWIDLVVPAVAIVLYVVIERHRRKAERDTTPTAPPATPDDRVLVGQA
jgi:hypothetical protein